MSPEIIVALLALMGTTIGSLTGILAANRLTTYRIHQLERKVDEHNNHSRRIPVMEEQIKVLNQRINDLEGK